jgi:class 3 adenylate cyclase
VHLDELDQLDPVLVRHPVVGLDLTAAWTYSRNCCSFTKSPFLTTVRQYRADGRVPRVRLRKPPEARFCSGCGASLVEAAPLREVRKTVTVVFCDVTGPTALGERLDRRASVRSWPGTSKRCAPRSSATGNGREVHRGHVELVWGDPAELYEEKENTVTAAQIRERLAS